MEAIGRQTMKDLVMSMKPSAGFGMLLELGMPDVTAEAVVLRHPETFDPEVQEAARKLLVAAGVSIDSLPKAAS